MVTATLAREPVNALDGALIGALEGLLAQAIDDPAVAVLHLRSDQKAFCAGADLALLRCAFASPEGTEAMIGLVLRMQRLFERIEAAPLVTLAELGGAALGGGLELALACDLRVAAAEARPGLVQWAVPRAGLPDRARALALRFAGVPRPALAAAKRCIAVAHQPDGRGHAAEIDGTRLLYAHAETRRRVAAFLDRSAARATKGAADEVR